MISLRSSLVPLCSAALLLLSSFNHLPDWIGQEEEEVILPGERIALKRRSELFTAEIPMAEGNITLPPEQLNTEWRQPLGDASGISDHLTLNQPLSLAASANVGDNFTTVLTPAPVVENNRIFTLDGNGTISAHHAETLELLWQSDAIEHHDSDDALLGGGLAVAGTVLYAVNDEGKVIAQKSFVKERESR